MLEAGFGGSCFVAHDCNSMIPAGKWLEKHVETVRKMRRHKTEYDHDENIVLIRVIRQFSREGHRDISIHHQTEALIVFVGESRASSDGGKDQVGCWNAMSM